MQNHGFFNDNLYGDMTIQAPGEYEEDTQNSINTYVTGLVEADLELERLIQYFEQSTEPTILVFFGDHLPLLGAKIH